MSNELSSHVDLWIEERHRDIVALRFRIKDILFSGRSEFQKIDIVETEGLGKMLFNDGLVMISERDEFIYHEMITHVPLFVHPNPERVLIIGGGDGGTAREVIRHSSVATCRMVEIDEMVVNACKEHIPQTASCLTDPRIELTIEDGVKFVNSTDEKFDVVIVDSTDPIGPGAPLFGAAFYKDVSRVLADDGIVVSQAESPFYEQEMQRTLLGILQGQFDRVHLYNFPNLTYPGGLWSFSFASNSLCPIRNYEESRIRQEGLECSYYNPAIHRASFVLPEFIKKDLREFLTELP